MDIRLLRACFIGNVLIVLAGCSAGMSVNGVPDNTQTLRHKFPSPSPSPLPLEQPSATPLPSISPVAHGRSLWVWSTPDNATLVSFAQQHGISEIFYSVSPSVDLPGSEKTRVADLHARTLAAGIALDALGGDPTWADNGSGTAHAITWENNAMATGFFRGAHFDIEPSPPLSSGCSATEANAFTAALAAIHKNSLSHGWNVNEDVQIGEHLCTSARGYPTLTDGIIANTDQITVMSYRNVASGGNGIWDVCQDAIARAYAAGKPARCGAETNSISPSSITFYGYTVTYMPNVLNQVDALAAQSAWAPTYKGIAIEDYAGYSRLEP